MVERSEKGDQRFLWRLTSWQEVPMKLLTKSPAGVWRAPFALLAGLTLAGALGCGKSDTGGTGDQTISIPASEVPGGAGGVDILFMIDNSSSMTWMQQKL